MKKTILISGGLHWKSPFQVGSHHIAKGFADLGWKVGFLSDPISPFHLLSGINQELIDRWNVYKLGGRFEYFKKIWCYVPGSLLTPNNKVFLKSNWLQRNWHKLSIPNVNKKLKQNEFDSVDILFLGSPNDLYLLDHIKYKKSILRIADKTSAYPKATSASVQVEREIAHRVDLVIYSAENLKEYVNSLSPKQAMYFPNGVNYHHFADGSKIMPSDLKQINQPVVLYVGAIAEWFDFDLINYAAQKLPDISFVLIGPTSLAKKHLKNLPNIHLLGVKKFSELPGYMHNADLGIIPFDVANHPDLVNNINPLKLYEYMACNLPVIAVEWQELKKLNSPSILYQTKEDFIAAIKNSLIQGKMDNTNLQDYAHQHDWGKQLEKII